MFFNNFIQILSELFNALGFINCHQISDRTLTVAGILLPMCARDTGIYLGFVSSLFVLLVHKKLRMSKFPVKEVMLFSLFLTLPMVLDVAFSYTGLLPTNNIIRLSTGLLFGAMIPLLLFPLINEILDTNPVSRAIIDSWKKFVLLVIPLLLIAFIVLFVNHWLIYVIASITMIAGFLILYFSLILLLISLVRERFKKTMNQRQVLFIAAILELLILVLIFIIRMAMGYFPS